MKYLILLAALLATPALAEDAPPSPPAAARPEPAKPVPQVTSWDIVGLDASDLATLNAALEELPHKIYVQFTQRLNSKIRPATK